MKRLARRDKIKIYRDILAAIQSGSKTEKTVLTHIQQKTNVPFDRLKTYISELGELGLIRHGSSLQLTGKGQQYLIEYEKVREFMERMGLAYHRDS
jgi:predicted transcriptional regulator